MGDRLEIVNKWFLTYACVENLIYLDVYIVYLDVLGLSMSRLRQLIFRRYNSLKLLSWNA